jgi:hypothetical protein
MNKTARIDLRQRADYTHKHNLKTGRHGWLRLTPAYSVKVVEELVDRSERPMRVYDPFCGTATTALSAAYHGHEGITTDINPFLVWLGNAKTAHYTALAINETRDACTRAIGLVKDKAVTLAPAPPIHHIERWWSPQALDFLRALRAAIDATTAVGSQSRTLLLVSFCRTLIALSNAAFNHQSMSFKDDGQIPFDLNLDMGGMYADDVRLVLNGATDNPEGDSTVLLGDARDPASVVEGKFDRVITSPPYANRMSYIRELRPYMYWLGFLMNGRDAGELDWTAIGGTWGMATSRLNEWERPEDALKNGDLESILDQVAHADNKNGKILSTYIAKYFDDMWLHFRRLPRILAPGADIHYIVGNSTFYGVLLPVERLYAAMMAKVGFGSIECRAIRKRNSKKELIEFDVTAVWPS